MYCDDTMTSPAGPRQQFFCLGEREEETAESDGQSRKVLGPEAAERIRKNPKSRLLLSLSLYVFDIVVAAAGGSFGLSST